MLSPPSVCVTITAWYSTAKVGPALSRTGPKSDRTGPFECALCLVRYVERRVVLRNVTRLRNNGDTTPLTQKG